MFIMICIYYIRLFPFAYYNYIRCPFSLNIIINNNNNNIHANCFLKQLACSLTLADTISSF